jgi:outer membrane receptor protein involved in Fe transport
MRASVTGFLLLVLTSSVLVRLAAQTAGQITGEVHDASGAIIPGAEIVVENEATGAQRSATTNEAGVYNFPSLLPGSYVVKASKTGFRPVDRTQVVLEVQQTVRIDFNMEVGNLTQAVEVQGSPSQLDTEDATVGTVIENKRVTELPLNGRNFLQLVALSPNTNYGFSPSSDIAGRQGGDRTALTISVGGQRIEFNYYTLDGIDNTDVTFNTYMMLPSVDALLQFKVQTGIYPAEFGREISQVNVSTKAGTNAYHGALFEFLRNSDLDARPYSFTAVHPAQTPFRWNQYGFTLGGPVSIPKLFNGRNRLFFMTNFEGFREREQSQGVFSSPTTQMRSGDLSRVSQVIYDPTSRTTVNGQITATPFPGNIIPTSRLSATSQKILEFLPPPNINTTSLANNLLIGLNLPVDKDQFTQRIDFVESNQSTWFGRYSWSNEDQTVPVLYENGSTIATRAKQAMISNTRVFSPTIVNDFRFGFNHFFNTLGPQLAFARNVPGELNIPGIPTVEPAAWSPPGVAIAGFSQFGGSSGPWTIYDTNFQWVDNVSIVRGKHSLRFGTEIRRDRYNEVGNTFLAGNFNFTATATVNPLSPNNSGYGLGDYLLGYMSLSQGAIAPANGQFRATSQAYYADDTWKVAKNVTVTLGLRYENVPPWFDRTGTLINLSIPNWERGQSNVQDLSQHPVLVRAGSGGFYDGTILRFDPSIQVARDGRLGPDLLHRDNKDFAPRLGIAWSPTPSWTIRAGAGIFYAQDNANGRFDLSRNIAGREQVSTNPSAPNLTWSNPFASLQTVTLATPTIFSTAVNRVTPREQEWLLNIERELGKDTLIEVGYLGSESHHLEYLTYQNEAVPAPITAGSTTSRRPFPELAPTQFVEDDGNANYNSLSVKFQRRFKSGLTYLASYTWSKSIDYYSGLRTTDNDGGFAQNTSCLQCDRGLSAFNVPHRIASSVLYELPFGAGRRFLNHGGFVNEVLGGWQIGSIVTWQTGSPFTIVDGTDQANTGRPDSRPSSTGVNANLSGSGTTGKWFNTSQFFLAPYGTFGTTGRSTGVGPGLTDWDFSTLKNFRITESHALQFRFEAFNILNHPNWGFPNSTFTSASFGQITTTRIAMRQLQFALKYVF